MSRIMLIVWKWRDWEEKIITEEYLQKLQDHRWLNHIETAKNELFDEYQVCYFSEEEVKMVEPEAKVIRVRIEHDETDQLTLLFLGTLITKYEKEGELFVFLHRKDGFTDRSIRYLLEKYNNNRYFLFGEGRDYIYYQTQNEGLLGDDACFFSQKPNPQQPGIAVADDKRKLVFQPHFDKVWNHYKYEFYTKIYELKEDLLSHFVQLLAEHFDRPFTDYLQHMEKASPLLWRVKSFMDQDYHDFTDKEKKQLADYSYEQQKSFVFDDCRANLSRIAKVDKEYDDVVKMLHLLLFGKAENGKPTLRYQLKELNREFEELLEAINDNLLDS